jgi:HKD family nuclease
MKKKFKNEMKKTVNMKIIKKKKIKFTDVHALRQLLATCSGWSQVTFLGLLHLAVLCAIIQSR